MADSEMVLAYIGKMMGELGAALAGNNQNLQAYGKGASATNENLLADIQMKKYEEEQQKEADKGFWGDLVGLGGAAASVAFPAAAPIIAPATAAASGAITGGTSGAIAGGLNSAVANVPVKTAEVPEPVQPVQPSMEGPASARPAPTTAPETEVKKTNKFTDFASNVMSDPTFQQSLSNVTSRMTAPKKPHLSTVGLNPETAFALRDQVNQQENQDRQFQQSEQDRAAKDSYYAEQNQIDRERLELDRSKVDSRVAGVDVLGNEPIQMSDGTYAYSVFDKASGQVRNIPAGPINPQQKTQNQQFMTIAGVQVPAELGQLAMLGDPDAKAEVDSYVRMNEEVAKIMAPYRQQPQQPYVNIANGAATSVARPTAPGEPPVLSQPVQIPMTPEQEAEQEKVNKDKALRGNVTRQSSLKEEVKTFEESIKAKFTVPDPQNYGKTITLEEDVATIRDAIKPLMEQDFDATNGRVGSYVVEVIQSSPGENGGRPFVSITGTRADGTPVDMVITEGLRILEGEQ